MQIVTNLFLTEYIRALFIHTRAIFESNSYQVICHARLQLTTGTGHPVYNRGYLLGTVSPTDFFGRQA